MSAFYAESNFRLDVDWAEAAFRRLFEDAALGCVWIAERSETPVGHVVLTLRYAMEHGALCGHIDDLYVKPESRRQGVARTLVSELVRECEKRNCKALFVEVGEENTPALRLYREFGIVPFEDGRTLLAGGIRCAGT